MASVEQAMGGSPATWDERVIHDLQHKVKVAFLTTRAADPRAG